ncbi:MAG: hypothetical protein JWR69_116 [Pedosphaera sp.]|nr:hypothetical protein [Pedosphaera sp.]
MSTILLTLAQWAQQESALAQLGDQRPYLFSSRRIEAKASRKKKNGSRALGRQQRAVGGTFRLRRVVDVPVTGSAFHSYQPRRPVMSANASTNRDSSPGPRFRDRFFQCCHSSWDRPKRFQAAVGARHGRPACDSMPRIGRFR